MHTVHLTAEKPGENFFLKCKHCFYMSCFFL